MCVISCALIVWRVVQRLEMQISILAEQGYHIRNLLIFSVFYKHFHNVFCLHFARLFHMQ